MYLPGLTHPLSVVVLGLFVSKSDMKCCRVSEARPWKRDVSKRTKHVVADVFCLAPAEGKSSKGRSFRRRRSVNGAMPCFAGRVTVPPLPRAFERNARYTGQIAGDKTSSACLSGSGRLVARNKLQ